MGGNRTQRTGGKSVFTMLYSVLEPPALLPLLMETLSVGNNSSLKSYKQETGQSKFSDAPRALVCKPPGAVWLDSDRRFQLL